MKIVEIIKKQNRQWICIVYIDDLADLSDVETIDGLPRNTTLAAGSIAYDKTLNTAVLNNDGEWTVEGD